MWLINVLLSFYGLRIEKYKFRKDQYVKNFKTDKEDWELVAYEEGKGYRLLAQKWEHAESISLIKHKF
jgi:hypothetical protein